MKANNNVKIQNFRWPKKITTPSHQAMKTELRETLSKIQYNRSGGPREQSHSGSGDPRMSPDAEFTVLLHLKPTVVGALRLNTAFMAR